MKSALRWITGLCLAYASGASAIAPQNAQEALTMQVQRLAASSAPEAWLLGAVLADLCPEAQLNCERPLRGALVERVLAQPPADPVLLRVLIHRLPDWLADDPVRAQAERARLLTEVQTQDPAALESWLPALPGADPARRAEVVALLARAAQSTQAGADMAASFRWASQYLKDLPIDPAWADGELQGLDANQLRRHVAFSFAVSLPGGAWALSRWCQTPDAPWQPECAAIARTLVHSDTLLDRSIGASLMQKVAATPAEQAQAQQWRQDANWLSKAMQQCRLTEEPDYLRWMDEGSSEIELLEAGLIARGLPVQAPADPTRLDAICPAETVAAMPPDRTR